MAYLRDRRAFGNIGTRKFRGARFGDPLSPRGPQYTLEGRVLDYSTDVGPFTIVDQSGESNTATLYSGRGLTMDAVNDTVTYATGYSSASRTATLWGKFNTTSPVALLGSVSGSFIFTPTATGVWEELTSTATVEGDLAWDLGLDFDIGDLVIGTEHWTHNDWSDPTGDTSNGKTIVDSGPNDYHGTCIGCSGFTGEATIPQTADKNWNKYQWFNGTDTKVTVGAPIADVGAIEVKFIFSDIEGVVFLSQQNGLALYGLSITQSTTAGNVHISLHKGSSVFEFISQSGFSAGELITATAFYNFTTSTFSINVNGETGDGTLAGRHSPATSLNLFQIGANGNDTFFTNGIISDLKEYDTDQVTAIRHYTGLGNDPWADTIGTNDGTEAGTFTRELVTASDANIQIDALGTAISEPRLNTQQLNLFGEGEYSSTPDGASLDLTTTATWEIWGNFYGAAPASTQAILSKTRFSGDERTVDITKSSAFADNTVNFTASSDGLGATIFSKTLTVTDKLSHIVFTYDGATQTMVGYIDGVPTAFSATTGAASTSLFANTQPYMIGARPSVDPAANYAPFKIGSTKIYNVALTADEVLTNYNTQKSLYGL
jgi:hypothetical protein